MDQAKIGKFIAECRKNNNLTQMQLAEKLNITDRAISKWENGRSLPDSSIMLELCSILKISVNDLLCGEVVEVKNYNKILEDNLLEVIKQKEEADKRLLALEVLIGAFTVIIYFGIIFIASFIQMPDWLRVCLIIIGFILFFIGMTFSLKIEQTAGYYECGKCHHKYVPTFVSVVLAPHINRTRYLKCPECNKRSWSKKTISKK